MQISLEQFRCLLQAAAQEISQIELVVEVAEDSWHLELDGAFTMQIFLDAKSAHVEFYAELIKPAQDQELSVLQILLCLQYAQEDLPRPRLAMDKPDGNLCCLLDVQVNEAETKKFAEILENFCAYFINLCDVIRAYPQQGHAPISSTHLALQV